MDQYLSPILSNHKLILSGFLGTLACLIVRDVYRSFLIFRLEFLYQGPCRLTRAYGALPAGTQGTVMKIVFDKYLRNYVIFNCIVYTSESIPVYMNIAIPMRYVEPHYGN